MQRPRLENSADKIRGNGCGPLSSCTRDGKILDLLDGLVFPCPCIAVTRPVRVEVDVVLQIIRVPRHSLSASLLRTRLIALHWYFDKTPDRSRRFGRVSGDRFIVVNVTPKKRFDVEGNLGRSPRLPHTGKVSEGSCRSDTYFCTRA